MKTFVRILLIIFLLPVGILGLAASLCGGVTAVAVLPGLFTRGGSSFVGLAFLSLLVGAWVAIKVFSHVKRLYLELKGKTPDDASR